MEWNKEITMTPKQKFTMLGGEHLDDVELLELIIKRGSDGKYYYQYESNNETFKETISGTIYEELKKQIDYCKNNMILYTGKEYMEGYEEEYDI